MVPEVGEGFPLSPQQRRLWEVGAREAGTPFTARCAVRVTGPLDADAAWRAVIQVVQRHEVLRTSFHLSGDMRLPLQVIGAGAPAAAIELTPIGPAEHELLLRFPGLCCDRRSLENLVGEIVRAYGASGANAQPAEPPLQYADAAAWLNDAAEAEEGAPGRAFWQRQGAVCAPRLPFELEPAAGMFSPQAVAVGRVPEWGGAPGARFEWHTLACWIHLLQRLTDTAPITMAIEIDGRQYAELEPAVGLYARTVPLPQVDTSAMSAEEAGAALAAAVSEARQWSEVFDWGKAAGHPGGAGVAFAFEIRRPVPAFDAGGVRFAIGECESPGDRFDVKLVYQTARGGPDELALHFDAGRYAVQHMENLGACLRALLAAAAAGPAEPLSALPLVNNAAREMAVPADHADSGRCVHRLFEDCVRASPESIAVTCEDHHLTYSQLNARANQLAHRLKRLGVGPDTAVGLSLPRSTDLIVGALGILKAGGGYLPLDPKLPASRLEMMAATAGASLVVTDRATNRQKPIGSAVLLDDDDAPLASEPAGDLVTAIEPSHLAYVLFTSGSTGQPKGVAVEHRQLSSYVEAVRKRLDLPAAASYATVTTMAADLGNTSIFPALTSSGRLHVVTEERAADASAFAAYCSHHAIDVLKIVPSHLRALLTVSTPAGILPRQRLILGGEACPWDLVGLIRDLAPACRIFNHYGPTETTVGAAAFEVTAGRQHGDGATVPIGRALDNAAAYVLDPAGRPVPEWFTGELVIGGHGVARGYVNARAGSASPFVPDPFRTVAGARMYRTGDRVRLRPGGMLEFLGRIDDQIKIRGYRIEPGEIEATLRQHAGVRDAAVIVKQGDGGAALIAAVAAANQADGAAVFDTFLRSRLPDYMVPAVILVLADIPRNANGKVDRAAIDALASRPQPRAPERQEIRGDWEQVVATLWQELLGVDEVHPDDNFYDLGGHSLLAIQAVTALERRRGVTIAARDLVFHTLRQFAALCESKAAARA